MRKRLFITEENIKEINNKLRIIEDFILPKRIEETKRRFGTEQEFAEKSQDILTPIEI